MINNIIKKFILPNKKEIIVYKIFKIIEGNLYNLNGSFQFSKLDWNSCYWDGNKNRFDNIILECNNGDKYECGFHSFTSIETSKIIYNKLYNNHNYIIYQCRIKYRLAEGTKNYVFEDKIILESRILVSRGIKIIKEIRKLEQ